MKITKEQFKNIVREVMTEESEYQKFFAKALEKTGKSIPDMSDEEKKAFFNKIDAAWDGKGEKKNEGNAFGAAVSDAKEKGEDEFEVGGEKFKVEEANTISAPGEWVAYLSMTRGKKLLKTFNTARGAKQFLSKNVDKLLGGSNVESVGIMTKKQWDEREAKYAIEGVNEASKPTIKVVTKLKNEQGIQIVVVKTTKGETEYGGFVVRGKLQKFIPVGANKTKEGVKKRALQIWDEFGKQLDETVNEEILKPGTKVKVQHKGKTVSGKIVRYDSKTPGSPFYIVYTGQYDSIEVPAYQVKKESVNEGKLGDTWKKNNKKGYILKVGNIELKSAGPSNSHDILVNRMPWGTFAIDYEAGGTDWWVKPLRGSDFWVDTIDDLVKRIKASK